MQIYKFKSTYFSLEKTLILLVFCTMALIYLLIYLTSSPILSTIVLLLLVYSCIELVSAIHVVSVNEQGLSREIRANYSSFFKTKSEFYSWDDVVWYKYGKDRNRYGNEYQFLKIKFKSDSKWQINDSNGSNQQQYIEFLNQFLQGVETKNKEIVTIQNNYRNKAEPIKQRKTFYDTWLAKCFVIVFGVFLFGLLVFLFKYPSYMKLSYWIKFSVILIPGYLYICYRTFIDKK